MEDKAINNILHFGQTTFVPVLLLLLVRDIGGWSGGGGHKGQYISTYLQHGQDILVSPYHIHLSGKILQAAEEEESTKDKSYLPHGTGYARIPVPHSSVRQNTVGCSGGGVH